MPLEIVKSALELYKDFKTVAKYVTDFFKTKNLFESLNDDFQKVKDAVVYYKGFEVKKKKSRLVLCIPYFFVLMIGVLIGMFFKILYFTSDLAKIAQVENCLVKDENRGIASTPSDFSEIKLYIKKDKKSDD